MQCDRCQTKEKTTERFAPAYNPRSRNQGCNYDLSRDWQSLRVRWLCAPLTPSVLPLFAPTALSREQQLRGAGL